MQHALQVCMGGAHPIVNSGPHSVFVEVGSFPICYPFPGAMILSLESGGEVSLQSFMQRQEQDGGGRKIKFGGSSTRPP